jgi:RNA polymerase sigma-70 factor (ECF subfamily)
VATGHDYERIFREAGPALWRALYAFTGGQRQIAEDAMAEAFALAMAREGIRDPAAWIYRTALRLARREIERQRRTEDASAADLAEEPAEFQDLLGALRTLSPNQRAAVVLRYEGDLPVAEVAELMGLSAATVRVHLFRARRRLREVLGTEDEGD